MPNTPDPSSFEIVYDANGDWGGLYLDGTLIDAGHYSTLVDTVLYRLGVKVRQVPAEYIMTGRNSREVHLTLDDAEDADLRHWIV
jgi:hypothetical protein